MSAGVYQLYLFGAGSGTSPINSPVRLDKMSSWSEEMESDSDEEDTNESPYKRLKTNDSHRNSPRPMVVNGQQSSHPARRVSAASGSKESSGERLLFAHALSTAYIYQWTPIVI